MTAKRALDVAVLDCGAGRIGLSRCPGLASNGDFAGDVARLRAFGAEAIVTLLDRADLRRDGLEHLGDEVERLGLDWLHVPVPDFGVPGEASEARWRHASVRLRRILARGGAVAIHCHAGIGRTGTFAARLLIDSGVDPEEAIRRVRAIRPGAIETPGQIALVRAQTALPPLPAEPTLEERVLGSLLGGAVGDGFGYEVEFQSLESIRSTYGDAGLLDPVCDAKGRLLVSDDTQMTMFTAEGLIRAFGRRRNDDVPSVVSCILQAYRRWLRTQEEVAAVEEEATEPGWLFAERALHARRAPGLTCLGALRDGGPSSGALRARNHSKGCGGVMRVAPVGLLPKHLDPAGAFRLGADAAAITHGHPTGFLAAGAVAAIVRALVDGAGYEDAATESMKLLAAEPDGEETSRAIVRALELARAPSSDPVEDVRRLGEGWVAEESLAIGLYAAIRGRDLADVVRIAANHDGDSDSTASIAGQLHSARHGVDSIPHAWIRRLDVLDPLLTLALDLASLSIRGEPALRRYPPN